MRRFFIIFIILIVLGGIGYFLIRAFSIGKTALETISPSSPQSTSSTPTISAPSLTGINYWVDAKRGEIFMVSGEGQISKASADLANVSIVQTLRLANVTSAIPSQDGNFVLFASEDSSPANAFQYFDFTQRTLSSFSGDAVQAGAFSPTGSTTNIVYLANQGNRSYLKTLSLFDKQKKDLVAFDIQDAVLDWKLPNEVYISQKPSAVVASSIWAFDLTKKTFREVMPRALGLMVEWSTDGTQGIKFTSTQGPQGLQLINSKGEVTGNLQVSTLPSKCLIQQGVFYCAVPKSFPDRVVLPDDYLKHAFYTEDTFYIWDSTSTSSAKMITPDLPVDAEKLQVYKDQLYFMNRYDKKLYRLPLPALR